MVFEVSFVVSTNHVKINGPTIDDDGFLYLACPETGDVYLVDFAQPQEPKLQVKRQSEFAVVTDFKRLVRS